MSIDRDSGSDGRDRITHVGSRKRTQKRTGREAAAIARLPEGCCLYTLRHSFITEAISQELTTLDVACLCGTSVLMIEKHYGYLVADAARDRLARVEIL